MDDTRTQATRKLHRLQKLMHRVHCINAHKEGLDSNRGQGRVLAILKLKPEISQKELGFLLDMSKQALGEVLGKLEKNGFITREVSEDDSRSKIVKLTQEGKNAAEQSRSTHMPDVLDCLNDEELIVFSEYLDRITARCEEIFPTEDFEERRKAMEEFMDCHDDRGAHARHPHHHHHHHHHHDMQCCCRRVHSGQGC